MILKTDVETQVESLFDDSRDMTMTISSPKKKFAMLALVLVLVVGVAAKMYGSATAAKNDMVPIEMLSGGGCTVNSDCPNDAQCCVDRYNYRYPICMHYLSSTAHCFP